MTLKHIKCLDLYQCQGFLPLPAGERDFLCAVSGFGQVSSRRLLLRPTLKHLHRTKSPYTSRKTHFN